MPYLNRTNRKTMKQLKILIDTGATACYIKKYSIIRYYHIINIFETRQLFYEIEGLESDLLIEFNLLRKIGAIINIEKGVLEYKGKTEKLKYYDNEEKNEISLIKENNILPLKEFIIKKYFDEYTGNNTRTLFLSPTS